MAVPAIIRDLIGTGVYGAEYLVASKQIWDFDLSAGLGWGRLADNNTFTNPFGEIFPSFRKRNLHVGGTFGLVDFGQFFHGPSMGLFGGLVWHSPIERLNVLIEYSSDRYRRETGGTFRVNLPINFGIS